MRILGGVSNFIDKKNRPPLQISAKIMEECPFYDNLLYVIIVLGIRSNGLVSICTHDPFGANIAVDVVAVTHRADGYTTGG